ncbi:MAG: bifunctional DNA primase/polymerase, partial [Actinobacteria bacterium]|nr:bifunctional DNA primase/polymerase [Actinomycetota bacterium]
ATVQGGTDVLEALAADAGASWPETYTVMTPSGGLHLYFRAPVGEPIGCATGDGPGGPHLGPCVDVRGLGGLVIAAGSYSTAQGRPYTRVSPPELRPQELPGWLLELLRRPAPRLASVPRPRPARVSSVRADRYADAALDGAVQDVATAVETTRNSTLFARARRLAELAHTAPAVLNEDAVERELLDAAVRAGLGERAALATIRSGWSHGVRGAGHGAGAA